jgi:putative nucleotidyltransferase with HDIG domain
VANRQQTEKTSQVDEGLQTLPMVASAADLTRHVLYSNPARLAHSQAVARRAELLALAVDQDSAPLLVAAAWLHDIGYAPGLRDTGYHPIDGARYLQSLGWPPAICNLVAHHSGARFVATVLQLDRQLDPYPFSQDALSDALTVADQTTGPRGEAMTVEQRMSDMLRRHGPNSPNALAHPLRERYIRSAATRVAERLERRGVDRAHHRIIIIIG